MDSDALQSRLPERPIERLSAPLTRFLHVECSGGVVLLIFTIAALLIANSSLGPGFLAFWKTPVGFRAGSFEMSYSLQHWINDGLMAIFFFVVGLEVKREMVHGELRTLRSAALPLIGALGGMAVPAALYLFFQLGQPGERGWGIAMATDIAFVVGCMAVLGKRVPHGLKIFLLTLAIADDIGAILVIAIGYTSAVHLAALVGALVLAAFIVILTRIGVRSRLVYLALGLGEWFEFHESGVHATVAGVLLGLLTPAAPWVSDPLLGRLIERTGDFLQGGANGERGGRMKVLRETERAVRWAMSPLDGAMEVLHPWVSFGIMPLFALANAGVVININALGNSLVFAVIVGLLIGKPLGITLFSWVSVRLGVAVLPAGVSWPMLMAGGLLAGIGFTMSLFIAGLALQGDLLDTAKLGILIASAMAAACGIAALYWTTRKQDPSSDTQQVPPDQSHAET
jgi:Na+:H+ antiporter, NhaA family